MTSSFDDLPSGGSFVLRRWHLETKYLGLVPRPIRLASKWSTRWEGRPAYPTSQL